VPIIHFFPALPLQAFARISLAFSTFCFISYLKFQRNVLTSLADRCVIDFLIPASDKDSSLFSQQDFDQEM